jgi:pimeloyl-ACP methyl ester carboxylesterase
MGGYVAFAFMRLFPQRVRGLILVDTRAEADTLEAKSKRERQAETVLRNGTKEVVDQMIVKMFTEETARENPKLVERVRTMMESTSPTGIAGALLGMAERPDSTVTLESIRVPTLILVGSQDSVTTVEDAKNMASRIPESQLVVVPEAGHLTTLERPVEVNLAIDRFLRTLPSM